MGKVIYLHMDMITSVRVKDKEAWRAAVRGVPRSRTQLSN